MMHWLHDHWFPAVGAAAGAYAAQVNLPESLGGFDKISSTGIVAFVVWFILTQMQKSIKENTQAIAANSAALQRLVDHLEKK
jgi:hypothetical protein